jgi:amino acid adenylation domain-containing protein
VQTHAGALVTQVLPPEVATALHGFGKAQGATMFMTLLAAFSSLLSRYSGQDEVVVGTPIANRTRVETELLIGFFVNTLAMRATLGAETSFAELVAQVKARALGAYAHQDVPFERLVDELRAPRDTSRSPIFQVMFALQNMPEERLDVGGLTFTPLPAPHRTAKFDLSLGASEGPTGLMLSWEYNTDLFDRDTIETMARHFEQLVRAALAQPETPLLRLPIVDEAERAALARCHATHEDLGPARAIHARIGAQAARTPAAIALVDGARQIGYAELERDACRVANALRARGAAPGTRVVVRVGRRLERVAALLGVLKTGAAYVPIEPDEAPLRTTFMLESAGAVCVVDDGTAPLEDARVLPLAEALAASDAPGHEPDDVDAPAYVLFTSGSTGRPKGVVVAHRAVSNHFAWMQSRFPLGPDDGVLLATSMGFDVSVWETFAPLSFGARCVMGPPVSDVVGAARALRTHGVTMLQTVPAVLALLVDEGLGESAVREVFCGGEALPPSLAARFAERCPRARLHNHYGPTEACIDATAWTCAPDEHGWVPIGVPLANTRAYVVDDADEELPVGIPGELLLAGAGLAQGYLGDDELTAARFVTWRGQRVYRSGDRVRRRARDGALVFLGRLDQQIKVRGVRLELGEVEAALATVDGIREAAVALHGDELVAYVVGDTPEAALVVALARALQPPAMPSRYLRLPSLPRLPNGKLERRALPAPAAAVRTYEAPQTPREERLAAIFASLLEAERVGRGDDFFALGGHSLRAVQLVQRVREAFEVEVPLKRVFQSPTPAALARVVDELLATAAPTSGTRPALAPIPRARRTPYRPAGERDPT